MSATALLNSPSDRGGRGSLRPSSRSMQSPGTRSVVARMLRPHMGGSDKAIRLQQQFENEYIATRRPRKADSSSFRRKCIATLRVLVLNLVAVQLSGREAYLLTPRSKTFYAENRFWIGDDVTASAVAACTQFFVEQGYVIALDGNASPLRVNRRSAGIQATLKFAAMVDGLGLTVRDIWRSPSQDLIQLRAPKLNDGTKRRIPFQWTEDLKAKAANLGSINQLIQDTSIRLNVSDAQWSEIMVHIARKRDEEMPEELVDGLTLDLTQKALYRVFNNGSFDQGGRFYGGWWQAVPKKWRSYITIAGRKVVELDYAAMHPTALSHQLGLPTPSRFYEIGVGAKPLVKATFNALINARGTSIKPIQGFDEKEAGMSWSQFLQRVKAHFQPFREYFGTGQGLKLQKLDSDIAEAVMLHFARQSKVVLPVHDSFLCDQHLESELAFIMEEEFRHRTGGTIRLKRKRLSQRQVQEIRARSAPRR